MSSIGTSKGVLEIAKFGVYVSVPVALTYLVATDSKTLKKLMGLTEAEISTFELEFIPTPFRKMKKPLDPDSSRIVLMNNAYALLDGYSLSGSNANVVRREYVVYPPEGPRPPPPEELRERARKIARKRQQQQ
ncbi:hypothetical protein OsJ_23333 [Oryza sativa Japonica Group]|uniref:Uncharacterized protein n=1 Tax=Oryza sativa subsp. japonica TaxID=39947 RepID=Q6ZLB1_ORYSJ|nr:hypothetical protein OsJ_23333 [Oryza sativa Japonica Group]BAC83054.1 hypothetical protein [Oryza sativa Japonica Group]